MIEINRKLRYRFKGYDWSELSEKWQLPEVSDDENLEQTKKVMMRALDSFDHQGRTIFLDVRSFVRALAKYSAKIDHSSPVWEGLLKVQNKDTFVLFAVHLLDCMWN